MARPRPETPALEVAAGSVLVFLDDDAVARSNWLQNLTAPLARPSVVGVGGHVEPIWLGRPPKWMPEEFLWVVGASYRGMPSEAAPVRNAWSENMAVAKADFWAVNGFREGFGKTGQWSQPEDTDFCMRLTDAMPGRTWWYEPLALGWALRANKPRHLEILCPALLQRRSGKSGDGAPAWASRELAGRASSCYQHPTARNTS